MTTTIRLRKSLRFRKFSTVPTISVMSEQFLITVFIFWRNNEKIFSVSYRNLKSYSITSSRHIRMERFISISTKVSLRIIHVPTLFHICTKTFSRKSSIASKVKMFLKNVVEHCGFLARLLFPRKMDAFDGYPISEHSIRL